MPVTKPQLFTALKYLCKHLKHILCLKYVMMAYLLTFSMRRQDKTSNANEIKMEARAIPATINICTCRSRLI